jgi:hypothetical protein
VVNWLKKTTAQNNARIFLRLEEIIWAVIPLCMTAQKPLYREQYF